MLRMKNGQSLVSIARDSCASASESGTGDDLMIAEATSGAGIARLFRFMGVAVVAPGGLEKNLNRHAGGLVQTHMTDNARDTRGAGKGETRHVHPHTLGDAGEPAEKAAPAHLCLA